MGRSLHNRYENYQTDMKMEQGEDKVLETFEVKISPSYINPYPLHNS